MTSSLFSGVLSTAILSGASLFYAALGELVGQKAGIVNLGLEGLMLIGAATGFAATFVMGDPYLGLAAAAAAGIASNLIFGYLVIGRGANQLAAGLTLMFFGMGVSALVGRPFVGDIIAGLPRFAPPGISTQNNTLFRFDVLVYLAIPAAILIWWLLFRTRWGLELRAAGESAAVAFAAGKRPRRLQYQALILAGTLAGIAGAHLSVALTLTWAEEMTAGRGFIAIALVIFSKWNPLWLVPAALVFGSAEALQLQLQARGTEVSPFIMSAVPYLLTLAVLVIWGWNRQNAAPAGLGRNFLGVE
jgi:general nucleoside transport system permease protein